MAGWKAGRERAETELVDRAIAVLNRVHAADPKVLPRLISYRVACNRAVADDPAVQVGLRKHPGREGRPDSPDTFEVGLLGIVNGILGVQPDTEYGWVAAVYDDTTRELTGFRVYEPEKGP